MSIEKVSYALIVQEQRPFTTLYSEVIQNISNAFALGIYTYLSSLPSDWTVSKKQLMNHFNVGRDKIISTMNYLKDHYLIEHGQYRNSDGTMGNSIIIVKDGRDFILNFVHNQKLDDKHTETVNTVTGKSGAGKSEPTYINNNTYTNIKDIQKAQPKKQVAVVSEPIVLPDWLPSEIWEEFKQHRKQLKKPMSDLAQKKSIKQLEKMMSEGQDIVEVIEASIANGWQGLFNIKSQGDSHGKGNSNTGTGRKEKFDSLQYLLDRRRARQGGRDNNFLENFLSEQNSEHLRIE
jgi:hypothetical protein